MLACRYCEIRFGQAVRHMPLEAAAAAPLAHVDPTVYLPPALRCVELHCCLNSGCLRTLLQCL